MTSIRTTLVGSYPVPQWLVGSPSRQGLLDATKVVLQTQELAGIDVVADGELYRWDANHPETNGMIEYFVKPLGGVRAPSRRADLREFGRMGELSFRPEPAGVVEGPLDEGSLNLPRDYYRARGCTDRPLKFTVTGPHMLSKTLLDHYYSRKEDLALAIADVLAGQVADIDPDVLQLDEANITGHPEEGEWAAEALNRVLDAASKVRERAVHLCFGNYGGQPIQKGHWRKLLQFMNRLRCHHVVLEFAFRGYDELKYFRDELDPAIGIGLGVVDVKSNVVESADAIAGRIETAIEMVGEARIQWVHPDCGFWMTPRTVADQKIEALVRGRDRFLGKAS